VNMKLRQLTFNLAGLMKTVFAFLTLLALVTSVRGSTNDPPSILLSQGTSGDTNEVVESMAELEKRLAPREPSAIFANAPGATVRIAAATEARAAAWAARQSIREEIETTPTGARAAFGPHKVEFPSTMPGIVEVRTPEGLVLRSRVMGLCYLTDTGKSVLIAELKQSTGELLHPNMVIFRDAFDDVAADVVYEYTRSSFEQSIVIRQRLPPPADYGFAADENVGVAVLTEFLNPPVPRKTVRTLDLSQSYLALGISREESLRDETLGFGSVRMVEGKSFSLDDPGHSVPAGKTWEVLQGPQGEERQFLIEVTPYHLIQPQLEALPAGKGARLTPDKPLELRTALLRIKGVTSYRAQAPDGAPGSDTSASERKTQAMAWTERRLDSNPGVVLDYILVTTPLLNVEFGWGGKSGFAAVGQESWDYWNQYYFTGNEPGTLTALSWSDTTQSPAGIIVTNGPGTGDNPFCLDLMYRYFVHPTNGGNVSVMITNLPSDVYDVFVYATRASDVGAPVIELKRGGTSIGKKGTTQWGNHWYSSVWEEGEQYVRFRKVAVTNQSLTLISYPDVAGYASLSGVQIVSSDALPSEEPEIEKLLNVNFGGSEGYKVGPAAAGLATNDYWNPYQYNWAYSVTVTNLKWSDQNSSGAGMMVRNAPGSWGTSLWDPMLHGYKYAHNGGNLTIILTNLPSGNADVYLYTPNSPAPYNSIFELWSDEVGQGTRATTLQGWGASSNFWENGIQYVRFTDVAVSSNKPVVIHVKHCPADHYQTIAGMQIAYKGEVDSDGDGLPDAWEMKWFGHLDWAAGDDPDGDDLSNLREYQLGLEPYYWDSNRNGVADWQDNEFPWVEDAVPQGGYAYGNGETWNWVTQWYDGDGWGGETIEPRSGTKMRVSANVTNAVHQHYFERSVSVIRPGTGEVLYAWIKLDSTYPPAEIMLQFYTVAGNGYGTWEHRAYWGSNNINWGTDGTASRKRIGDLPATGEWVRLEVPASELGLEERIIEGMAFTLWGGRAAWDSAGIFNPDMDGDGLPDWWELEHFDYLGLGSDDDPDGDGWTNWEEFQNNTDPTRAELAIVITKPKREYNVP
jgi:hypothetical protein